MHSITLLLPWYVDDSVFATSIWVAPNQVSYVCPIALDLMKDSAVTADGYTYGSYTAVAELREFTSDAAGCTVV